MQGPISTWKEAISCAGGLPIEEFEVDATLEGYSTASVTEQVYAMSAMSTKIVQGHARIAVTLMITLPTKRSMLMVLLQVLPLLLLLLLVLVLWSLLLMLLIVLRVGEAVVLMAALTRVTTAINITNSRPISTLGIIKQPS